jgi:hypothetical protein
MIATWFDLPEGRSGSCLDMELARKRAGDLRRLILKGSIAPGSLRLTDDLKNVLYALVELVESSGPRKELLGSPAREVQQVYDFIRGIHWPDDVFSEKNCLLKDCVRAGANEHRRGLLHSNTDTEKLAPSDGSSQALGSLETEARQAFDRSRNLIARILLDEERLSETEAADLEQELFAWFSRFCRRANSAPPTSRAVLLAASVRFAQAYRSGTGSSSAGGVKEGELIRLDERQSKPEPGGTKGGGK